jgi:hypothetical protein
MIANCTNIWNLNNMLLNSQGVNEEIKRENKKLLMKLKWKTTYQNLRHHSKSSNKREMYSNKC